MTLKPKNLQAIENALAEAFRAADKVDVASVLWLTIAQCTDQMAMERIFELGGDPERERAKIDDMALTHPRP